MRKVWLHTWWLVAGVESGRRSRFIDMAWLTTVNPPYYRGSGVSVRVGRYSMRGGVCYPRIPVLADPDSPDFDDKHFDAIGGREVPGRDYTEWASSQENQS